MPLSMYALSYPTISHINDPYHIQEFLLYHKLRSRRPGTLKSYEAFLKRFFNVVGKVPEITTVTDVRMFLLAEERKGNKPTTLATKIAILRSFYAWLEREEYIEKSPMRRIDKPKIPQALPKYLTYDELEAIRETAISLIDKLLVEVLYSTGARVSELVAFDWADIDLETKRALIRDGKGGKQRVVFLSTKAVRLLRKYKVSRTDTEPWVFRSRAKCRMSKESVEWHIRRLAKRAGIQKRVTPHCLRHSIATHLLAGRMPLEGVQKILGHTKASTTQIYAITQMNLVEQDYRMVIN
jgi:integrase/recombinase XerD